MPMKPLTGYDIVDFSVYDAVASCNSGKKASKGILSSDVVTWCIYKDCA